ncbi:small GTP-binding protein domain, partial [Pseudoloma neurophilia]
HEPQLKDLKPQLEDLESKTEDHDNERFKNVITKDLQNERIIDDLTQTVKNKLKLSKVSDDSDLSLRENSSEIGKTSLDAISDFEKNNNTTKIENLTHLYRYFALDQQVKHIQVRSEHNNLKNSHSSVDLLGISPYAIRLQGKKFSIVKLFSKMSEGEQVFCVNDLDGREAVIDKIYIFNNDTLKRTNSVTAGSLIAVESNLLRNCAIFKNFTPTRLSIFKTRPFYIESIRSNDTIIQKIKDLSYFEPILRAKVNKFNNIELFCEGKMHFEKIACDLNNDFVNVPNTNYLLEGASQTKKSVFEKDKIVCEIEMKPLETIENEI